MNLIKRLFCRHEWDVNLILYRVHGPADAKPIYDKVEWKCPKCGKVRYGYRKLKKEICEWH